MYKQIAHSTKNLTEIKDEKVVWFGDANEAVTNRNVLVRSFDLGVSVGELDGRKL